MLTATTQEAVRLLRYIYYRDTSCGCPYHPADCIFEDASVLLLQIEAGRLIPCVCLEAPDKPESYELCKPLGSVSLLSLLLKLNEGVHPVSPDVDEQRVYGRYGVVASRMGVVNQMMRSIFGESHLTDLCL